MNKLASRILALGGAAVLALGAAGVTTAQAGYSDCAANRVCIWRDIDYIIFLGNRSPGGGVVNISTANDNKMSSWGNRTGTNAAWYWGTNGGSPCLTMGAGLSKADVGSYDNDKMSSWRTDRGC